MAKRDRAGKLELKLIKELRRDSSRSISEISRKLNSPITTVFEAERKLRKTGTVKRYYSSLDFEKAGFAIRAFFLMKVDDKKLEETAKTLMEDNSVNNLQVLEGGCNLLAEAVFRKISQFFSLSERLSEVREKKAYFIIEEMKTEAATLS